MSRVALLAAVALIAVVPAPAGAATVDSAVAVDDHGSENRRLVFSAAAGEPNSVVLERAGDRMLIRDSVPVGATGECRSVDAHTASCPTPDAAIVRLGDGDDRAELRAVSAEVHGGDGDDRLIGGSEPDGLQGEAGDDELDGGAGGDGLYGGSGVDVLRGGVGNDALADDEGSLVSPDAYDGGRGEDTVNYAFSQAPVRVDLGEGTATGGGQADRLAGIESAYGGAGDDVLIGDGGRNRLVGLAGRDTLRGEAGDDQIEGDAGRDALLGADGDDRLSGGGGRDRLSGGAGDDVFGIESSAPDVYRCGAGADHVESLSWDDRPDAGCETASAFAGGLLLATAIHAGSSGGRVEIRVTCLRPRSCSAGFVLRRDRDGRPGALLARSGVRSLRRGRSRTVRFAVRRRPPARAHLVVRDRNAGDQRSVPVRLRR